MSRRTFERRRSIQSKVDEITNIFIAELPRAPSAHHRYKIGKPINPRKFGCHVRPSVRPSVSQSGKNIFGSLRVRLLVVDICKNTALITSGSFYQVQNDLGISFQHKRSDCMKRRQNWWPNESGEESVPENIDLWEYSSLNLLIYSMEIYAKWLRYNL